MFVYHMLVQRILGEPAPPPAASAVLLESGDFLLLESGDKLLLE